MPHIIKPSSIPLAVAKWQVKLKDDCSCGNYEFDSAYCGHLYTTYPHTCGATVSKKPKSPRAKLCYTPAPSIKVERFKIADICAECKDRGVVIQHV
jgi:hypothetical protein